MSLKSFFLGYIEYLDNLVNESLNQGHVDFSSEDFETKTEYQITFDKIKVYMVHRPFIKFEQQEKIIIQIYNETGDSIFWYSSENKTLSDQKLRKKTLVRLADYVFNID